MRALVSIEPGLSGLELRDWPMPEPGAGQVRIRVRAAALNFPDLLMLDDKYQAKRERPYIPGMEVAGEIDVVGPEVTALKTGDAILGFALGGFAEYAIVDVGDAMPVPHGMSFVEAAGFMSSYATAIHALRQRGNIQPGETMLVLSAGGALGLATVQLGKVYGARVIAAASSQERVDLAIRNGADDGLVYATDPTREDSRAFAAALKAIAPKGFDLVADIVGGPYTEPSVRSLGWNGRLLILGFAAGVPQIAANLLLLKSAQAVGVFHTQLLQHDPDQARRNNDELFRLYESGAIKPYIGETLPLDRAIDALRMLDDRTLKGKAVIVLD